MEAFNAFVSIVRSIRSVEQIRAQVAGTYLHLVTYVSESTLDERDAIYQAELSVHDRFPDIRFEFDLIDRMGNPVMPGELTNKLTEVIRDLPDKTDVDSTLKVF